MEQVVLPPIHEIDVEDLGSLPRGYSYELHAGSLVIGPERTVPLSDLESEQRRVA